MSLYADKKDFIQAIKQINDKFAELDAKIAKLEEAAKPKTRTTSSQKSQEKA